MSEETETKTVKLTLVGLDGNAFALMGAFSKAARRQGWEKKEIDVVLEKCQSGDYDNLLRTLMEVCEDDEDEDDEDDEGEYDDED